MRISGAFPSKYLKAADIPDGKFVPVVISHVDHEDVGGKNDPEDHKPVLYFQGKQKGMVLNRTNAETISAQYGDETDEWSGKQVMLYASEVQFNGKMVPCLRVKIVRNQGAPPARAAVAAQAPVEPPFAEEQQFKDDDIPF
jgi:hypothetical protein